MDTQTSLLVILGGGMFLISAAVLSGLLDKKVLNLLAIAIIVISLILFQDQLHLWWLSLKWKMGW